MCIYSAIQMVELSNPGTYGTRKCSSWCADIHKSKYPDTSIQKSNIPKIQKSENQKNARFRRCEKFWIFGIFGFLDFWIWGFLGFWVFGFGDFWIWGFLDLGIFGFGDFWIFCVLHMCFQSAETAPKLDSEETAFVSVFTVFFEGVCVS